MENEEQKSNIDQPVVMGSNYAVDEAVKMMAIPMNKLPEPAIAYLKKLSKEVGFCGEVCITAYAYYNQAVLNMPCDDSLYKIPDDVKAWFVEHNYCP